MHFELFARRNLLGYKRWYFRLRASNGQIVAQSEGYSRRIDAVTTAESIRAHAGAANIVELK